ncbi:V-type ATP synthase subunit E [Lagierella sp.]|uniref:V-type ATP synthase subunit E n=1 Tax=Lagierella sp. TaxID=2849657 RepID=UPI0026354270|nr:V-type ATP synthase subunit E [Lagierella sp.]
MSNLDNIINQILKDAKSESDQIIKEAEEKRDEELAKIESKAKDEKLAIISKAELESQNLLEKILNSATLKARDEQLEAKQGVIEKIIKMAKEKLKNLDEQTYLSIVQAALKKSNLSNEATISLQENRVEAFKKLGLNYKISDKYVENGFKFYDGNSIINNDFSGIVDFMKQDLETLIVQKLFEK